MNPSRSRSAACLILATLAALSLFAGGCQCHQRILMGNVYKGPNEPPSFSSPVCLRVEREDQIVTFYVRPNTGSATATAALTNSQVALDLADGTAMAAGVRPVIRGTHTTAGASGTGFGMRVDAQQELYFVHSSAKPSGPVVHVARRKGDSTTGEVIHLAVGKGCRYNVATNTFDVFDPLVPPGPGSAPIPPDLLMLVAETKAVLGP